MKTILTICAVSILSGCQQLGLSFNDNSQNRLKYKSESCEIEMWQSHFDINEAETVELAVKEMVNITADCTLTVDYSEQDMGVIRHGGE